MEIKKEPDTQKMTKTEDGKCRKDSKFSSYQFCSMLKSGYLAGRKNLSNS